MFGSCRSVKLASKNVAEFLYNLKSVNNSSSNMFSLYLFMLLFTISSQVCAQDESRRLSVSALRSLYDNMPSFSSVFNSVSEVLITIFIGPEESNNSSAVPVTALMNITGLTKKHGYVLEEHEVITEDGYILTLHRIPKGRNATKNNLVVFLMHGIVDSADTWLLQGPDNALAYILADKGFDVWLGNARGNKYSLSHVNLQPAMSEFWNFTWEEIGLYDLPAMIDHALNITGQKSMYYIGHSQGTTTFYVMTSMKPEYNEKIKMMFSLAPVAWMQYAKSPILQYLTPDTKVLGYLLASFNTYSPSTDNFNRLETIFCSVITDKCDNILYKIIGNDSKLTNASLLPVILGHMPTGSSYLQFMHYGQLVQSGRFCRYDYGEETNMEIYGQIQPPEYNLTQVTVPVSLYYSGNDWLSDPKDVDVLKGKIKLCDDIYIDEYNHLDFLYASCAKDFIYSKIIQRIYEFENKTKCH